LRVHEAIIQKLPLIFKFADGFLGTHDDLNSSVGYDAAQRIVGCQQIRDALRAR
jgi:hypothetical protein